MLTSEINDEFTAALTLLSRLIPHAAESSVSNRWLLSQVSLLLLNHKVNLCDHIWLRPEPAECISADIMVAFRASGKVSMLTAQKQKTRYLLGYEGVAPPHYLTVRRCYKWKLLHSTTFVTCFT